MINKLNDSQYANGVIPLNQIRAKQNFVMNWDIGAPTEHNQAGELFRPGMKQQAEADSFIAEVTEDSVIFDNSTFRPLTGTEYDYSFLDSEIELQSMRDVSTGKQIGNIMDLEEGTPSFKRKSLYCQPLLAYTSTPWLQVQDNLEGDRFLSSFQSQNALRIKFNMEKICAYGKKTTSPSSANALYTMDGFLEQLDKQHTLFAADPNTRTPQGVFCGINGEANGTTKQAIDFSKTMESDETDAVKQLEDMLTQFGVQKGNVSNAKFYMSNEARAKLVQIAQKRETVVGDSLYFEGADLKLWGTPIVTCDVFDQPVNGFKTNILLADLNSYVIGMKRDIETDSEFNMRAQTYDTVTKVYFDNLVLREKDMLCAECKGLPSQTVVSSPSGT